MKFPFYLILLIFIPVAFYCQELEHDSDELLILTQQNFELALENYENVFVMFTAPWCGHCKKFRPYFIEVCKQVTSVKLKCAKMDSKQNQDFITKYRIGAFPSVKLFKKDKTQNTIENLNFDINAKNENMAEWLFNEIRSPPIILPSDTVQSQPNLTQIIYFTDSQDISFIKRISESKDLDYSLHFYQIQSKIERFIIRKEYEEVEFPVALSEVPEASLIHWIQHFSFPKVISFDEKIAKVVFKKLQPMILCFLDGDTDKQYESVLDLVAENLREEIFIVKSIERNDQEKRLTKFLDIELNEIPLIKLIFPQKGEEPKQYQFKNKINSQNLLEFYKDWKTLRLNPEFRSEAPPLEQTGPVIKVVGKTFGKIVLDEDKDVLVKFYAPWCGHCREMAPIYEELAEAMKDFKNIVIAEYDATMNNNEGINIKSFPTIKFYPAKDKQHPLTYNEDRSVQAFKQFLQKHNTVGWEKSQDEIEKIEL